MDRVLMLGDSLIEWGDWQTLLPDYDIINRGMAGEDVEGLSQRLHDETKAAGIAQHVLIMAGTNNLLMGSLFFPAIFKTMLPRLRALCPQSIITLNAIFPMEIAEVDRTTIERVNHELQQVAAAADCRFLNTDQAFSEHCLPITHPCFLEDGIHLSTRGYNVWADAIRDHLQGLKKSQ